MQARTDLAMECLDFARDIVPNGVKTENFEQNGIEITRVRIETEEGARILGKPIGDYLTIDTSDFKTPSGRFADEVEAIATLITSFLPSDREGCTLIVGLGNRDITPDALGPKVIGYSLATRHISKDLAAEIGLENLNSVAAIATAVTGQTGIETAEMVSAIVKSISPTAVIVIDALASKSVERLATTVQISNSGISPGSGVQNSRKELSEHTLGVPVISVGVPMVVDMTTVAYDMLGDGFDSEKVSDKGRAMMVTPREIDLAVEHAAKTVAFGINRALQPSLSLDDLTGLVG